MSALLAWEVENAEEPGAVRAVVLQKAETKLLLEDKPSPCDYWCRQADDGQYSSDCSVIASRFKTKFAEQYLKSKYDLLQENRHVLCVNEKLSRNQVYADSANFAFVYEHIISLRKKAKVTYK